MQHLNNRARYPSAWQAGGGNGQTLRGASTPQHFTTGEPLALQVSKRGRWCTVGKVTFVNGEPILGIAHRFQAGVDKVVSVPLVVLDYAEACGCLWLYFRRDLTREAWRISLADLRKLGYLGPGAGAEFYIHIDKMEPTNFPNWQYAETTIRLNEPKQQDTKQTALAL
ncbi:MAG: hypothetical protein M1136_05625 [Chloroflexi bacterium]|nr:hypothetical protein [Chloroflexota bacterium]